MATHPLIRRRPKTDITRSMRYDLQYLRVYQTYLKVLIKSIADEIKDSQSRALNAPSVRSDAAARALQRLYGIVNNAYSHGVVFASEASTGYGLGISTNPLPIDQVARQILQERTDILLADVTSDLQARAQVMVLDGFSAGLDLQTIISTMQPVLMDLGLARVRTIAHTEIMTAVNTAQKLRYESVGVRSVMWLASQDELTCEICGDDGGYDGKIFPLNELPPCPAHPNCRCTFIAAVAGGRSENGD